MDESQASEDDAASEEAPAEQSAAPVPQGEGDDDVRRTRRSYEAGRVGYSTELYNTLVGFGLNPKLTVIDVGCGTGFGQPSAHRERFHVTGIDISEPMLEKARSRFPGTWIVASAEKIPFTDSNFDVAICAQSIHHLNRPNAVAEMFAW